MCGITGYISNNITKQELEDSVNELKHRGPNNQNTWMKNNVGLGHTRLSILDLSDNSNQPLVSHSERYIMIYNGEVYNYLELANKYKIKVKTNSDSEVLLELFNKLRFHFVEELNGMFAITIFDKQENELFLFRDRIGIKPLFYYFDKETFAFASEIKALLKFKCIKHDLKINKASSSQFLNLGYIAEPNTFFQNIYKFPSGSYASYKNSKLEIKSYWKVEDKITPQTIINFSEAKDQLNNLLLSSVENRMISDVPLGTFLSGGIDSSLVTALAQKISSKPIKTFSIGFKESKFNESKYAKRIANYLKTDHQEFIVSEDDVLELVDKYFNAYDEPFADSSGFPTMLISKLAKQQVSVILSGDGGDELFHGYGMYNWAERLNNPIIKTFRKPIGFALSKLDNKYKRAALLFQYSDIKRIKAHIFSQEQYYFSENELEDLLVVKTNSFLNEEIICNRKLSASEEQSIFDIKHYLKDDLLVKVDSASMQSALEVRVPLLDHRIIEFALNLNHNLKINNGEQKYLLKQVLYDYLPKELFDRPKWGFSIPLEEWLKTKLHYLLDKYTSKEIIEKHNIVHYSRVQILKQQYLEGQTFLYNRIWLIIILHKNLEKYFND